MKDLNNYIEAISETVKTLEKLRINEKYEKMGETGKYLSNLKDEFKQYVYNCRINDCLKCEENKWKT